MEPVERLLAELLTGRPAESSIDWTALVRRAIGERVAPLLFSRLARDARLPADARQALRSELYRAEASNLILYRELGRLLERGEKSGLDPPVLLKGGALASSLYDEIGHRPMGDIDILVAREALGPWLEVGGEVGLVRRTPEMSPGLDRAIHYHVALSSAPSGATIELHYGLIAGESDFRAPDPRWFLERAEDWRPPQGHAYAARQLDPTAHLLYMSAHAMLQHGGASAPMIWFHDLHLLIMRRSDQLHWPELFERATILGWEAALAAALERTSALFLTRIPEKALEPAPDGRGAREVRRRRDERRSRADIVWSELRAVGLLRGFQWGLGILFPRPEYMRWRYPNAGRFWPLLYPVRWGMVLKEGSLALLRRKPAG
jgi:Uncharacterised nucleotidyltransferase